MYQRYLLERVETALNDTPVVFINGPRQAGKSTLVQLIAQRTPDATYLTLDDLTALAAAKSDPQAFLSNLGPGLVIIDEVQLAPDLFRVIKWLVDADRRPGRFLLTGSANVLLLPRLSDSLAGRIEIVTLYPLSSGEISGDREQLIDQIFGSSEWEAQPTDRQALHDRIAMGGYPEAVDRLDPSRRAAWFDSYVRTVTERDIRELANIERLAQLPRLLQMIATRSSQLMNMSELSRTCGLPGMTLKRYFSLLQTVYLIDTLPAYSNHLGKRLVKAPKVHLNDTGLLCHLTGNTINGAALETYVINELKKTASWSKTPVSFYHYRTPKGKEVDLVLETRDGRVAGLEIKSAMTLNSSDFDGLKDLQQTVGDRFVTGIVLHVGTHHLAWGNNLHSLPIPF